MGELIKTMYCSLHQDWSISGGYKFHRVDSNVYRDGEEVVRNKKIVCYDNPLQANYWHTRDKVVVVCSVKLEDCEEIGKGMFNCDRITLMHTATESDWIDAYDTGDGPALCYNNKSHKYYYCDTNTRGKRVSSEYAFAFPYERGLAVVQPDAFSYNILNRDGYAKYSKDVIKNIPWHTDGFVCIMGRDNKFIVIDKDGEVMPPSWKIWSPYRTSDGNMVKYITGEHMVNLMRLCKNGMSKRLFLKDLWNITSNSEIPDIMKLTYLDTSVSYYDVKEKKLLNDKKKYKYGSLPFVNKQDHKVKASVYSYGKLIDIDLQ